MSIEWKENDIYSAPKERFVTELTKLKREIKHLKKELAKEKKILRLRNQASKLQQDIFQMEENRGKR